MMRQLSAEWRELGVDRRSSSAKAAALWQRLVEFSAAGESPLVLKASVAPSGTTAMIDAARRLDPECSIQAHAGNGIVLIKMSKFPGRRPVAGAGRQLAAGGRRPSRPRDRAFESVGRRDDASKRLGRDRCAAGADERGQAAVRSEGYTEPRPVRLHRRSRSAAHRALMTTATC